MFTEMTPEEIFVLGFGCLVMVWGLYKILTSGKFGSRFFYWLLVLGTGAVLWLWRSGYALKIYAWLKNMMVTPY